jgi:hypothetical protein
MIVILLSWLYILFASLFVGIYTAKFIKINTQSSVELCILGLFTTCILSFLWAFFYPINELFYGIYFLFVCANGIYFKKELITLIQNKVTLIKEMDNKFLIAGFLFILLLAIQTASQPTLPDNESYYIQTIKWINEFGFVKGLGNLHLFFAQTSGWHVLQSAYNFYFLKIPLGSLSGFISFLFIIFSFKNLHFYFKEQRKLNLIFGLFPVFLILFFPLINVPSPDVATYCISIVVFYQFLNPTKSKENTFKLILIYCIFLVLIKITNLPLLLISLVYFFLEKDIQIKNNIKLVGIATVSFVLLFAKNALITGYFFYPIHSFGVWNDFYKIPSSVLDYFFGNSMRYSFFIDRETIEEERIFFMVKHWLFRSYTDLFFNASSLLLFLLLPFLILKQKENSKIGFLYVILLIQFILLIFSSPQYRFFLGSLLFFFAFIASYIITSKKIIFVSLVTSMLFLLLYIFVPQAFGLLTSNKIITSRSTFSLKTFWITTTTPSLQTDFILSKKQKLNYYSPTNPKLFWETGNGKLPCVSKRQLDYFEKYFQIIPQPIGSELSNGFYAKKTKKP